MKDINAIKEIAESCGAEVTFNKKGKGGFIVDETDNVKTEGVFDDIINDAYENMDNHCYGCLYSEYDSNQIPCNTCLNWVDGYLTATNYKNKFE